MYKELNAASQARDRAQRLRHRLPRSRAGRDPALARTRLRPTTPRSRERRDRGAGAGRRHHRRLRPLRRRARRSPTPTAASTGTRASSSPACATASTSKAEIELAPRAPILAADGTPLAEGPAEEREHPLGSAAIDVTGEVGEAGEEDLPTLARQGFAARHPGRHQRPRAGLQRPPRRQARRLAAGGRRRRRLGRGRSPRPKPQPGAPVKTTIDPDLQEAAVSALAGRAGGIAVLDARNGDVRALAGQAFSAPQPPGSTFKMITTDRRAARRASSRSTTNSKSPTASTSAAASSTTPTASTAAAPSAKPSPSPATPTSPRSGPKIGNDELVATAERFGFNSPPTLYAPQIVARSRTGRIDDPDRDRRRNRPRRLARSARAKCWRRRCRWRASRRRSPTAASASRPRSSPTRSCGPTPSRCG